MSNTLESALSCFDHDNYKEKEMVQNTNKKSGIWQNIFIELRVIITATSRYDIAYTVLRYSDTYIRKVIFCFLQSGSLFLFR